MENLGYINEESEIDRRNENVIEDEIRNNNNWIFYSKKQKIVFIIAAILKILLFIALLYIFIISLNFMTIGFTLVSSFAKTGSQIIKFLLANPLGIIYFLHDSGKSINSFS